MYPFIPTFLVSSPCLFITQKQISQVLNPNKNNPGICRAQNLVSSPSDLVATLPSLQISCVRRLGEAPLQCDQCGGLGRLLDPPLRLPDPHQRAHHLHHGQAVQAAARPRGRRVDTGAPLRHGEGRGRIPVSGETWGGWGAEILNSDDMRLTQMSGELWTVSLWGQH